MGRKKEKNNNKFLKETPEQRYHRVQNEPTPKASTWSHNGDRFDHKKNRRNCKEEMKRLKEDYS